MSQPETIDRILKAATLLFSERGFAETSLRTITGLADVNLASVNYHFGSKKDLIQAVFSRFLTPFSKQLDKAIDELEGVNSNGISTASLLQCMFTALFRSTEELNEDPQRFMRLLGLAYTQSQEHLRHFIVQEFGTTYRRFTSALSETQPDLNPVSAS